MVNSPFSTSAGQALDERLVLADLAQHVLVVEEHADLGILRDRVNLALVLGRSQSTGMTSAKAQDWP